MVSSVMGVGMHDGPPSPHGDVHNRHSSRMMDGGPPPLPTMDYRHPPPPVGYGGPPPPPPHMPHGGYPYPPPPYYGGPTPPPPPPYGMPPGAYSPYYGHPGYGHPPPLPPSSSHGGGTGGGSGGYGYGYDASYGYPTQPSRDVVKKQQHDMKLLPQRKGVVAGRGSRTTPSPAAIDSALSSSSTGDHLPPSQHWRAPSVSSESSQLPSSGAAAAAADVTPSLVKPIETDFHFFVKEMSAVLRPSAEEEVHKSLESSNKSSTMSAMEVLFLVNSNLNTRLIKAWEDLTASKRAEYMAKEENDRRRFMNEDCVASRHCATLTARQKSPRADKNPPNNNNNNNSGTTTTNNINAYTKESRDPTEHRNDSGKPSPARSEGSSSGNSSDDAPELEGISTSPTITTSPRQESSPDQGISHHQHEMDSCKVAVKQEQKVDESPVSAEPSGPKAAKPESSSSHDNTPMKPENTKDTLMTDASSATATPSGGSSSGGKRVGSPNEGSETEEEKGTPPKRNRRDRGTTTGDKNIIHRDDENNDEQPETNREAV